MKAENIAISDAELELMKVLWQAGEPLTAQQVSERLPDKNWKYSTIATLFSRLVEKGAVVHQKQGRFFLYSPCIAEADYKAAQTRQFIGKLYGGSVKNLVAALFENRQMSQQDIDELKEKYHL